MKSKILIILSVLFVSLDINAAIGCMDDSKHTNTWDGCDYKTLNYVHCNCNCDQHPYSIEFGKCCNCGHYRTPKNSDYLR